MALLSRLMSVCFCHAMPCLLVERLSWHGPGGRRRHVGGRMKVGSRPGRYLYAIASEPSRPKAALPSPAAVGKTLSSATEVVQGDGCREMGTIAYTLVRGQLGVGRRVIGSERAEVVIVLLQIDDGRTFPAFELK
ncbi:hypothetical protein GQ53DRAFT_806991 [Thozetella sp. PMI_491]|nr:hypothetical protein GQ53DRAFT_806991 [Thozetella sp. PMI_491]